MKEEKSNKNFSSDASGILMKSVIESMAEYYSQELGQKIKVGIAQKKKERIANEG